MKVPDWIRELEESIPRWLEKVSIPDQPGRFYPCLKGRTEVGSEAALGFSCFALKIYRILGLWEQLKVEQRKRWIDFILSFQKKEGPYKGGFVDPPIIEHCDSWKIRIINKLLKRGHPGLSPREATLIAETKQAIATLADIGIQAPLHFEDFPHTPNELSNYLRNKLNWSRPWAAGGQAAALALFIAHEAPKFLSHETVDELKCEMLKFFYDIVDKETGTWFLGRIPNHGELINGAMKVLNALEWLDGEVPYPERLIDTCLSQPPRAEGCHLVDAVYVLYRCSQYTTYRRRDIIRYLEQILELVKQHRKPDGAFSYYVKHNQTSYYGAKIAIPIRQSDIHGTVLLIWAIGMIGFISEWKGFTWKEIVV